MSELWRTITPQQWEQPGFLDAVPRYLHYIRHLSCSLYFSTLDKRIQKSIMLKLIQAPHIWPKNAEAILSILRRNPNIKDFCLSGDFDLYNVNVHMEILQAVTKSANLKKLGLREFTLNAGTLGSLLYNLPQLVSLSIQDIDEINYPLPIPAADFDIFSSSTMKNRICSQNNDVTSQLQSLEIAECSYTFYNILMVIQYYPSLKHLDLLGVELIDMSLVLIERRQGSKIHFPNLERLRIENSVVNSVGFTHFLSAIPRLKRLVMGKLVIRNSEVLQFLLQQENLKSTLEEFEYRNKSPRNSIGATELILRFLQEYSALKEIRFRRVEISVEDVLEILESAKENEYTVGCQELRVFEVTISGYSNWAPPSVFKGKPKIFFNVPPDYKYEKYDSLVRYLSGMPNLNLDTITFIQKF